MLSIYFFKKGEILKKIFLVIITLLILLSSCSKQDNTNQENVVDMTHNKKIIATWITYQEIKELVDASNEENEFENLVYEKISMLKEYRINTIFIHVRAFDDCFYKSEIYPVSSYCDDENGSLKFDVLQEFIDICKEFDVKVHAWINPYRIRNDSDTSLINKQTLAYRILKNDEKEKIIITDDCIYYNPAYSDVQKYILDGIREILDNYKVDGIHIDDYFYPTTSENIDKEIFKEYKKQKGPLDLEDFRRYNVNTLISSIYSLVKSFNADICFSVSPGGDIYKNYNELYADIELWLNCDGYADYIIPQLYFGYTNDSMPFKNVLNDWIEICNDNSKLIIGLGIYKSGEEDLFAKSGKEEWINNSDIISRQIKDSLDNSVGGISFYSFSSLTKNSNNIMLIEERKGIIKQLEIYDS